jgi:segregation and condensation protein A
MTYQIKLEMFEGPFDLLFHLIDKEEVDIYDIPVAKITDQYLAYINTLHTLDLEVASEFLVLAATLIQIKSRMLLPKPPKSEAGEELEVDPRDELVARLLEYKKYKAVAALLKEREQSQGLTFNRQVDVESYVQEFAEKNPLKGLTFADLLQALQEVLDRVEEDEIFQEIPREEVSIRDRMREISRKLILAKGGLSFRELFRGPRTRAAIVITFIALLELIKLSRVIIHQTENFSEMIICRATVEPVELEENDEVAVS